MLTPPRIETGAGRAAYGESGRGAGAAGYVLKQNAPRELIDTIRAVAAGRQILEPTMHRTPEPLVHAGTGESREENLNGSLTDRDQRVLLLVARACSNEQIAQSLSISADEAGTVKTRRCEKPASPHGSRSWGYAQRQGRID